MMAIFMSSGSYIQQAIRGLLSFESDSFYGNIHKENINVLPDFANYILIWISPIFLLPAIMSSFVAVKMKNKLRFLIVLMLLIFSSLISIDVIGLLRKKHLSIYSLAENAIYNAIGALIIVLMLAMIMRLVENIKIKNSNSTSMSLTIVAIAFVYSGLSYSSVKYLMQPLPASATILLDGSARGYFYQDLSVGDDEVAKNFSLIPESLTFERLELTGADATSVLWKRTNVDTEFSLSVYPVGGCWSSSELAVDSRRQPMLVKKSVKSISLDSDASGKFLQTSGMQSGFTVQEGTISQFSLNRSDDLKSMDISQFFNETNVEWATQGSILIRLTVPTIDVAAGYSALSSKFISLIVDGEEHRFEFAAPKDVSGTDLVKCDYLDVGQPQNGIIRYEGVLISGLLVKLERVALPTGYVSHTDGLVSIARAEGSFAVPNIPVEELKEFGHLGFIGSHLSTAICLILPPHPTFALPHRADSV
jgi:hypothetical protein